jgi:hypothetical protein
MISGEIFPRTRLSPCPEEQPDEAGDDQQSTDVEGDRHLNLLWASRGFDKSDSTRHAKA